MDFLPWVLVLIMAALYGASSIRRRDLVKERAQMQMRIEEAQNGWTRALRQCEDLLAINDRLIKLIDSYVVKGRTDGA